MRLPVLLLLGVLLGTVALPAAAVTVDGLYSARVEVAGKGEEARAEGFRRALEEVLVRVSGNAGVVANPELESVLENPARYVQQYRYEALAEPPEPGAADADADADRESDAAAETETPGAGPETGPDGEDEAPAPPTHRLVVSFAGSLIERALSERGVVVWGEQRPEVLVWLAVDDGRERYLVGADGDSRAYERLSEVAGRRGLPLVLPLLDMTDRQRIELVDIKGGFLDAVRSASERYRAETLLVGYVEQRRDGWTGDWNLLGLGERRGWRASGADLEAAVTGGVGGATERIAAALAGRGGERHTVRLRVRALADLDAYARVARYLESLVRVRSAEVVGLRPDEAVFRLVIRGRVEELERTIALGNMLRAAAAAPAPAPTPGDTRDAGAETSGDGRDDGDGADAPAAPDEDGPADTPGPARELIYRLIG